MFPGALVVADHRRRILCNRAAIRLVIVLAGKIDDIENHLLLRRSIHAEVIPVGLPVTTVLVLFPLGSQPKLRIGCLFDAPQAASIKICVDRRGCKNQAKQQAHTDVSLFGDIGRTGQISTDFALAVPPRAYTLKPRLSRCVGYIRSVRQARPLANTSITEPSRKICRRRVSLDLRAKCPFCTARAVSGFRLACDGSVKSCSSALS